MRDTAKTSPAAPSPGRGRRRRGAIASTLLALAAVLAIAPAAASAAEAAEAPLAFWTRCQANTEEDIACGFPRGIATSSASGHVGHVYVAAQAAQNGQRVVEFTAWGKFARTFGWDVVEAGPGNDGTGFEVCVPANGDTCKAGVGGVGAGQLNSPQGVAVDSAGNVYVADRGNKRVQKFSPTGQFLLAWGGDVIATGPGNAGSAEVQSLTVKAISGSFTLGFDASERTAPIPYDASPAALETALAALPVTGGAVSVAGGPGNETGSSPYTITLSAYNAPQLTVNGENLGVPIGTTLTCTTPTNATTKSFQWLRNGVPIAGATTATYTTSSSSSTTPATTTGDEGGAIQCQVSGLNATAGLTQVSKPRLVVSPVPSTAPPSPPVGISAPTPASPVAGTVETCNAGVWTNNPTSYTYQWYANGSKVGSPLTTAETSSTYTVQAADVPSVIQCAVTGNNAGGSATLLSANRNTSPAPSGIPSATTPSVSGAPASSTATVSDGVSAAEICIPASGDTCKAGAEGAANGQFAGWPVSSLIAVDPADKVYVGDAGRIQRFDTAGAFQANLPDPEGLLSGQFVASLAADPTGNLYVGFATSVEGFNPKPDVLKLSPAGARLCTIEVATPQAIATDAAGNAYAVNSESIGIFATGPVVHKFGPSCAQVTDSTYPFDLKQTDFTASTGIATGAACLTEGLNLYVANSANAGGFVRAYGPAPDQLSICPLSSEAPEIADQWADSVGSELAVVRANINPHNQLDTSYYVQYGTAACLEAGWEAGCVKEKPAAPRAQLGAGAIDVPAKTAGVLLAGLSPATEYRYRFAAESSGGGPVFGKGGTEAAEGEEGAFTTSSVPTAPGPDACSNAALRSGPAARLLDCRAYEMVSPVDKGGGDIVNQLNVSGKHAAYIQSSLDGNKIAYSAFKAFGDQPSGLYSNQYIASRHEGEGWSSHGINAPQGRHADSNNVPLLHAFFKAFSPDLSTAWIEDPNLAPLTPDCPEGKELNVDLYRRDNAGDSYGCLGRVNLGGFSADLGHVVFKEAGGEVYDRSGGADHLVSVLPDGTPDPAADEPGGGELGNLEGAVAADGARVFWTSGGGTGKVYVRENPGQVESPHDGGGNCIPDPVLACTVAVSSGTGAEFLTAANDGSAVIYSEGADLYEFDVEARTRRLIAAQAKGLLGASDDLSRIYFASTEEIPGAGENSEEDEAQAGQPNLYLDEGGVYAFVATLTETDVGKPVESVFIAYNVAADDPNQRASRVTPDGRTIAFNSTAPLTGFDNTAAGNGKADVEVFVYEAGGRLACVSCDPNGARQGGEELSPPYEEPASGHHTSVWAAAWLPGWEHPLHASNALSEDGSRLFFHSNVPLVRQDTNAAMDVYEWEAAGAGDCKEASAAYVKAAGGCIALISSGESPFQSEFWDASPDGKNVFFTTAASLVPQDPGLVDLYDARSGGGFPQPSSPAGCEGEACQTPPAAPDDPTPASSAFEGAGNVKEEPKPRCRKGKVRRKGRCVAKHQKRAKRHHAKRANSNRRAR